MKTVISASLDQELVTYVKEKKINMSALLTKLLSEWKTRENGEVEAWSIDKASGAKFMLLVDGSIRHPNLEESKKYSSARAKKTTMLNMTQEQRERALADVEARLEKLEQAAEAKGEQA